MAEQVAATVLKIGTAPLLLNPQDWSFPTKSIAMEEVIDGDINTAILYNGTNYYVSETLADLETAANAGGGGGSSYLSKTVTLTDEQIRALESDPVVIIPAPGAEKYIAVQYVLFYWDVAAGAYGNIDDQDTRMHLSYGGVQASTITLVPSSTNNMVYNAISYFKNDASDAWEDYIVSTGALASGVENIALSVRIASEGGNLTGGNAANTLKIKVYYTIEDI